MAAEQQLIDSLTELHDLKAALDEQAALARIKSREIIIQVFKPLGAGAHL
jgi:hypothetical protein